MIHCDTKINQSTLPSLSFFRVYQFNRWDRFCAVLIFISVTQNQKIESFLEFFQKELVKDILMMIYSEF